MTPFRIARHDPRLTARVVARRALAYPGPAAPELDRPELPRAASGLVWFGDRLAVIQDDAEFLLRVHPEQGIESVIPLPPGPGGRRDFDPNAGGKRLKRDLECCVVAPDGRLIGFGSGSKPTREQVLVVEPGGTARYLDAAAFYRTLRRTRAFSGSRLNLEGVASRDGALWLFNRGNEPARKGRAPSDASGVIAWDALLTWLDGPQREPPTLRAVTQYALGTIAGCRYTFADACAAVDPNAAEAHALWYAASAERSDDAIADGPVAGAAIGRIDAGAVRQAPLTDANGAPLALKLEGLCPDPHDPRRLYAVLDADDPTRACELLELRLDGPWA